MPRVSKTRKAAAQIDKLDRDAEFSLVELRRIVIEHFKFSRREEAKLDTEINALNRKIENIQTDESLDLRVKSLEEDCTASKFLKVQKELDILKNDILLAGNTLSPEVESLETEVQKLRHKNEGLELEIHQLKKETKTALHEVYSLNLTVEKVQNDVKDNTLAKKQHILEGDIVTLQTGLKQTDTILRHTTHNLDRLQDGVLEVAIELDAQSDSSEVIGMRNTHKNKVKKKLIK